jgi:hypothetical protein
VQLDRDTGYQFSFETPSLSDGDVLDFLDLPTVVDVDDMTVALTAGDTIDVALSGMEASFAGQTLELLDPSGNVLATGSSTFAGQPITNYELGILGYEVPADGVYTVRVQSVLEDARYFVVVAQELTGDTEPNSEAPFRALDRTDGALGFIESLPALAGHAHYNDPSLFIDISQTGKALFFDHGDGIAPIYTTLGNAVLSGGKFLVGSDGVLMQNEDIAYFSGYTTTALPSLYFDFSALVPFWSDLENDTGKVYVDERVVQGVDTLIVQWEDRSYFFQSGMGTFQVQLFDRDPGAERQLVARYVYQDVDFANAFYDGGAEATIGLQIDQSTADMISRNTAAIANGDVIDFYVINGDRYQLDLAAGQTITLRTATPLDDPTAAPTNPLDPAVSVLDLNGNVLATDTNSFDGKNAQLFFTAPTAGTYVVSVFAESGSGDYVLHKSTATVVDGDFNDDGIYDLRDIDVLVAEIASANHHAWYDLSGDGLVDLVDRDAWLVEAASVNYGGGYVYLMGDANLDGFVDGADFNAWNAHKFTARPAWSAGDFNADGFVDGADFNIWNAHKFTSMLARPLLWVDRWQDTRSESVDTVFRQSDWLKRLQPWLAEQESLK